MNVQLLPITVQNFSFRIQSEWKPTISINEERTSKILTGTTKSQVVTERGGSPARRRPIAEKRLRYLEKRFAGSKSFSEAYDHKFPEYIVLDYARKLTAAEMENAPLEDVN